MQKVEVEKLITEFIRDDLLSGTKQPAAETSLFQEQILDSMALAELVSFLEGQFKVRVAPSEVNLQNLDTINNITNFIAAKL